MCILIRLLYSEEKSEIGHAVLGKLYVPLDLFPFSSMSMEGYIVYCVVGLTLALALNGVVTNFVKLAVGR